MKIIRLSFKNLNSLAGVWDINFTHPDYVSSGIFAITGPTGAGKTTILDAICLALYGQTPRLNRITQSENEIMSRQTGECFAEVEFETAKGRFRCHWSQHRSRKLADGQLQSPKHEICEAESGLILESKLRAVADKVVEVTGMDFERFTRSMLLAQGGFAAFLQAQPDERAPILEQITGTAVYSRISIKVHERTTEERKRLGEMRAELDGIQLLSPAELETLLLEKSGLQQAESVLSADAGMLRETQLWLERIATLEGELRQLDLDLHAFEARKAVAAPELELLEQAGRAMKLGGDHATLCSMRVQQEKEQDELTVSLERLPPLQLNWQAAFDALECAEAGLAGARAGQAEEAELIRGTRELDVKLGEAHAQIHALTAEIETAGRQSSEYRTAITTCDQRLSSTGEQLREIAVFLDRHGADAGLAEALTGIEQQVKSFKTLENHCRETGTRRARQAGLVAAAEVALTQAETAWQAAQQAVTGAEQTVADVRAAREILLQGRALAVWRVEAEAIAARQSRLGTIQETVVRIEEGKAKLAELLLRTEALGQKRQGLTQQEETVAGECELREQVARQLQDNVVLLGRVRSLEEDRKQLVDGSPCPLCGAGDHPYASGNIPQLDEARNKLELAHAEAKRVRDQLSGVRQELVAAGKDLHQSERDLAELQERLLNDETFCATSFAELGLAADGAAWPEVIRRETDACQLALKNSRAVIQEGERNEQDERTAEAALAGLKDELARCDNSRLAARLGRENALSEHTRLERETAGYHADLERVQGEVERAVAGFGCTEVVPDKVDELLASLTVRRSVYAERQHVRERLEKETSAVAAEREKQQALLAELEKMRGDKEQLLRARIDQRDALVEQRLEMYGERSPDAEEKRLAEAVRQAAEKREAALQEQNTLHAGLSGLNGQIERLTLSIAKRAEQLGGLEASFRQRLGEAGFADETALLQASLPQERFDLLQQVAESVRNEETALRTRHLDRAEALAGELDKHLTDKPLELIREEHAAVTGKLIELQKGLGALDQQLQQQSEQQQRHRTRLQAIEIQKRECDRWERLHSLIGSGDGKKFRNFAQGLTFELMVAHANRQLQKMSDRYILVRDGNEPLELNVIDNYQAGEIRSTKNLSGGESFIASLALSLGLSSMASRNVRVDSLFLDEGFGTLDEDALETALETLSGLQQDGKLIGIISHVPALKERIGTQIQVEAGSSGRSTLSGPGCRRIS